jgi:hypothetical protein
MSELQAVGVLQEIGVERARQIHVEGHTREKDNAYAPGLLANAGAAFVWFSGLTDAERAHFFKPAMDGKQARVLWATLWPWAREAFKPKTRRQELIVGAALIVAEIERMDRMEKRDA